MKSQDHLEVRLSPELQVVLTSAIEQFRPGAVVESGTNRGNGTTRCILSCLGNAPVESFTTIEVSKSLWEEASRNLSDCPVVKCLHGLSVKETEAVSHTLNNKFIRHGQYPGMLPADVRVDCDARSYVNEVVMGLGGIESDHEDDLFSKVIPPIRHKRPLICLDSAGSIGLLEFQEVCRLMEGRPYLLFLDDINHIKHYVTMTLVLSNPQWKIHGFDWSQGWAVVEFLGA